MPKTMYRYSYLDIEYMSASNALITCHSMLRQNVQVIVDVSHVLILGGKDTFALRCREEL